MRISQKVITNARHPEELHRIGVRVSGGDLYGSGSPGSLAVSGGRSGSQYPAASCSGGPSVKPFFRGFFSVALLCQSEGYPLISEGKPMIKIGIIIRQALNLRGW